MLRTRPLAEALAHLRAHPLDLPPPVRRRSTLRERVARDLPAPLTACRGPGTFPLAPPCYTRGMASPGASDARPPPPRFVQELDVLVRARYPLVYLVTSEEQRLEAILSELAETHGKVLLGWSVAKGFRRDGGSKSAAGLDGAKEPLAALAAIEKLSEPSLVVLKDFHPYLQDPAVVRALRELSHALKSTFTTVVLLSPTLVIPPEIEKEVSVLDVPLPTYRDLLQLLKEIVGVVRQGNRAKVDLTKDDADQLIKAALGLTLSEAENAFAKAIAHDGRLSKDDVPLVLEEKRQVIRKSGLLEYYPTEERLANVGGLDALKTWLARRGAAFSEAARKFGLPEPKGLLLLGVQGCGKSLTAKAIAAQWGLPLLRLDMGRIFSGLVGSSEENLRRAIQVAESVAPVVLWIDEIEKGLAGHAVVRRVGRRRHGARDRARSSPGCRRRPPRSSSSRRRTGSSSSRPSSCARVASTRSSSSTSRRSPSAARSSTSTSASAGATRPPTTSTSSRAGPRASRDRSSSRR